VLTLTVETLISAPPERCFDAARDLDLHVKTSAHTSETAVAGRMSGLIELGEEVTWRARHFGVMQHFTSRITAYDRPRHFQDTMQRGAFRSFVHDHFFHVEDGGTRMVDVVLFSAPLGPLGWLIERLVLRSYLRGFLVKRGKGIKSATEALGTA
jgi:ligand-binding SRPBCC domain-containing protein